MPVFSAVSIPRTEFLGRTEVRERWIEQTEHGVRGFSTAEGFSADRPTEDEEPLS
jgi:hypothetical protein